MECKPGPGLPIKYSCPVHGVFVDKQIIFGIRFSENHVVGPTKSEPLGWVCCPICLQPSKLFVEVK